MERILVLDDRAEIAQLLTAAASLREDTRDLTFQAVLLQDLERELALESWDMALVDIQLEPWHLVSAATVAEQRTGLHALDVLARRAPDLAVFVHTMSDSDRQLFRHGAFWLHSPVEVRDRMLVDLTKPVADTGPRARLLGVLEKPATADDVARCLAAARGAPMHHSVTFTPSDLLAKLLGNRFDLDLWRGLSSLRATTQLAMMTGADGSNIAGWGVKMVRILEKSGLIGRGLWNQQTNWTDTAPVLGSFAEHHRPFFFSDHADRIHKSMANRWRPTRRSPRSL